MRLALLLIVAACAMLNGCAEYTKPDPRTHAHDRLRPVLRGQATDEGVAIASSHIEPHSEPVGVPGEGPGRPAPTAIPRCHVEVVASESPLRRDAIGWAPVVGHVVRGETLTFLDFIDRRLRILGRQVFDGGYWLKVRGPRGSVG